MKVLLTISDESRAALAAHGVLAGKIPGLLAACLESAAAAGADNVGMLLQTNQLALKTRSGGMGIAGAVSAWMIDDATAAVGVSEGVPAHAYAGIQETGGTITAKPGKALAVPLNDRARALTSPRDATVELTMIKRPGKPPLLARVFGDSVEPWFVLLKSVTLKATHWLSDGVSRSMPLMVAAFQHTLDEALPDAMEGR
ncbi:MAG: hypothetical protein GX591_20515 [Planctomycetes bacterium]|nr:hypothetical protein [Planctomycetota bacterium]